MKALNHTPRFSRHALRDAIVERHRRRRALTTQHAMAAEMWAWAQDGSALGETPLPADVRALQRNTIASILQVPTWEHVTRLAAAIGAEGVVDTLAGAMSAGRLLELARANGFQL